MLLLLINKTELKSKRVGKSWKFSPVGYMPFSGMSSHLKILYETHFNTVKSFSRNFGGISCESLTSLVLAGILEGATICVTLRITPLICHIINYATSI